MFTFTWTRTPQITTAQRVLVSPTHTHSYHIIKIKHGNRELEFLSDDDVYDQLTFRESLMISVREDENSAKLTPIGGLCLDVQKAAGGKPPKPGGVNVERCIRRIFGENNENGGSKSSRETPTPPCGNTWNYFNQTTNFCIWSCFSSNFLTCFMRYAEENPSPPFALNQAHFECKFRQAMPLRKMRTSTNL